jgi:O-antigen ligase
MQIDRKNTNTLYYSLIIWIGVFIPGHLGNFLFEQIFIAFAIIWTFLVLMTKSANSNYFGFTKLNIVYYFLILQLSYVFSYFHSEIIFPSGKSGLRDYFELARYAIYLIFTFFIFFYYPRNSRNLADPIIRVTLFFSLLIVLIYIFKLPILNAFFEDFLYAATKDDLSKISIGGRVRFAAPFPNANYLAYFLCISLVYLLFFSNAKDKPLLIITSLLLLFLTGSRTGWLTSVVILVSFQITYIRYGLFQKGKFINLVLVTLLSCALVLLLFNGFLPNVTRLTELTSAFGAGDISSINSFAHRMEHNLFIWNSLQESLIWGLGPSKYSLTTVVDNQYLMWITRQGIIGVVIIAIGILSLFIHMLKFSKTTLHTYGIITFFFAVGLFCMTGAFLNNFRLFLLTIFLVAVIMDRCKSLKI